MVSREELGIDGRSGQQNGLAGFNQGTRFSDRLGPLRRLRLTPSKPLTLRRLDMAPGYIFGPALGRGSHNTEAWPL